MRTIHKFTLNTISKQEIFLADGWEFLDIQPQRLGCMMWVMLHDNVPLDQKVSFYFKWTGENCDDMAGKKYLKTFQDSMGLVWHVFRD